MTEFGFVWVEPSDCVDEYYERIQLQLKETKESLEREKCAKHGAESKMQDLEVKNQQLLREMGILQKERENLTQRLAKEMSDKVSADESNLENISIKNRPMVVAEEYEGFFSNQWLDLKNLLDDSSGLGEEEKIGFLCDLVMESVNIAEQRYSERLQRLHNGLNEPLEQSLIVTEDSVPPSTGGASGELHVDETHFSKDNKDHAKPRVIKTEEHIMNQIGDLYRLLADTVNIKGILEAINKFVTQREQGGAHWLRDVTSHSAFHAYTEGCARLAWKMVIQRPSMTCHVAGIGQRWNEGTQDVTFTSDDPSHKSARVRLYQYPALYHGDKLMVKGKVIVKIQTDSQ